MIFRQRILHPPLSYFVEYLWFFSGLEVSHTKEKLIPDGSLELILDLTETSKRLYDRKDHSRSTAFRRGWISGMQREYLVIGPEKGSSLMGAHFRTGGAAPFFGFPIAELSGEVVELDLLWKQELRSLRDRILEAAGPEEKFNLLESFLMARAKDRLEPDRAVAAALECMRTWPMVSLRSLAAELGFSQKQMIAAFDRRVGLTPKLTARVMRLQRVLHETHGAASHDWTDLALRSGYYDQAHMIHEFQEFTGVTPSYYAAHRTEYPNYLYLD